MTPTFADRLHSLRKITGDQLLIYHIDQLGREVLAIEDGVVRSKQYVIKQYRKEFQNRAPEIFLANAVRFEGSTPEEALEAAEFALGLQYVAGALA